MKNALAIFSATLLLGTVVTRRAEAQILTTLHNFSGSPNDGANPQAGLILDAAGNLYDTTIIGGSSNAGTVFKISE
jgi:hypothetical protein